MSVVAAVKVGKRIYMAAETLVSDDEGNHFESLLAPKIFEWNGLLFGVVGDCRIGDVIYAAFDPSEQEEDDEFSDYVFMCTDFVKELRACLLEHDVKLNTASWTLLVGYRGELYIIDDDFSVCVPNKDYFAIGSGENPAMGSLASTSSSPGLVKEPQARVVKAVSAAILRRSDCGGQIIVESI